MFEIKRYKRTLNCVTKAGADGWYLYDSTAQTQTQITSAKFEPTSHILTFLLPWGLADDEHPESSVASGVVFGEINHLTDDTPVDYDAEQTKSGAFPALVGRRTRTTFGDTKARINGRLLLSVTGTLILPDGSKIDDVHLQASTDVFTKLYETYQIDIDFNKPFWLGEATGLSELPFVSKVERIQDNIESKIQRTYSYLPRISNQQKA
mgnify:FL=1